MSRAATSQAPSGTTRRPIPPFTQEHERFRAAVRQFVEQELHPHAGAWEEARCFPNDVFGLLAGRGYIGLKFPAQYGGADDPVADAVFVEEMARCGSGGLAAGVGAHSGIALPPIWRFGTEEQRQRYLVPGIRGQRIAALAITEPDAGSDVAGIRTTARRVDGGYVVNGSKTFITGGVRADVLVTAVKTTQEGGHRGLSFVIIERGPGVESSALEKLGWHASDTALISFQDVFVPAENLLGQENAGFYLIMANFQWERLLMALGAVGAMQAAFERALQHARGRLESGAGSGERADGQAVRHQLAQIATTLEASRAVTYHALRRYLDGEDAVREVTIAKLATQRSCFEVMDACLQIHGLDGYLDEHGVARAARDARLGPIGGGTDEIMREVLGRSLGL
ncbi:MAG TPA: acyl-CoA dehydrogenase family protein [Solirubrobacteraceae bacterium]|nr:acyl-CoA dehydrogenase family protein [Solirubrobacteraceae bacterium]